jgi:hypothetical protein
MQYSPSNELRVATILYGAVSVRGFHRVDANV